MELPTFKYHPDPIATGSIKASDAQCRCCRQKRGSIYTGSPYCIADLNSCLCPWCIADGTAHEKFDAEFTSSDDIPDVPARVVEEVAHRTPGFSGWQQERWWTHCGDAGAYLGPAGFEAVEAFGARTIDRLRRDLGWQPGAQWDEYLRSLDRQGQPTAYLFRCLRCSEVGGYSDFT